jgi:ferredoxin--NADP+ reductase
VDEVGERIPLTLADWDAQEGTLTLVAMQVGTSTRKLGALKAGDNLQNLVGPLGLPSDIEKFGTVICVGGGVGIAPIYPIARSLKEAGNKVISIIGARNKDLLFWEDHMKKVSDELIVTTDDGSYARKGLVTEPLKEQLDQGKIDRVIAIGPAVMMRFCSLTTKPYNVPTIVSMNSIMVDGTGMCGCCRISVGGVTKFACVDGPDFDGHLVDWNIAFDRQKVYLQEEKASLDKWESCQCGKS